MPVVPGPRVATAPLSGAKLSPSAPSSAFGVQSGLDLSAPINLVSQLDQQARQDADETQLITADNKLHELKASIANDITTKYRGLNALGAKDAAEAAWQQGLDGIRQGVQGGDHVKAAVERRAATHYGDLLSTVESHSATEYKNAQTHEFAAAVDNKGSDAVRYFSDPEKRQGALDEGKAVITSYGRTAGWSPDELRHRLELFASDAHANIIEKMVNEHQDLAAEAYLKEHRAELQGKDLTASEQLTGEASVLGAAQRESGRIIKGIPAQQDAGLLTAGNIDLTNRPRVQNADGSISTVRSMSFEEDGKEILVPTVTPDGKNLTEKQAIARYHSTGEHLGIFANVKAATAYAQQLHNAQAAALRGEGDGTVAAAATSLLSALAETEKIDNPRVRAETEHQVRQHFADLATADREAKQAAFTQASAIVEKTGSFDAVPLKMRQAMSPEENGALQHREDQIRHPKEFGDPETYFHLLNLASVSPQSRQQFLNENILGYKNLSSAERTRLLTLQRQMSTSAETHAASTEMHATVAARKAAEDKVRLDRGLAKAAQITDSTARAAEERRVRQEYTTLRGTAPAPLIVPAPTGPSVAHPLAGLLAPALTKATTQQLQDAAKNPRYAKYLRDMHVDLPTVLPAVLP